MAKIFVSSTYQDLKDCRQEVRDVIRVLGHADVAMEYYVAEDLRQVDRCLRDASECDMYLGIFAWRYGWIPKEDNPGQISITDMEYRYAKQKDKPRLIFLLDKDAPWSHDPDKSDVDRKRIDRLRSEVQSDAFCYFVDASSLALKVTESIRLWERESELGYKVWKERVRDTDHNFKEEVRVDALVNLAERYHDVPEAFDLILRCADEDRHFEVRSIAIKLLARHSMHQELILERLRCIARKDADSRLRSQALTALVRHFQDRGDTASFVAELARDQDGDVRSLAIGYLPQFRSKLDVVSILRELASQAEWDDAQIDSIAVIVEYYSDECLQFIYELITAGSDQFAPNPALRIHIIDDIATSLRAKAGAFDRLYECATHDPDGKVRSVAVSQLADHFRGEERTRLLLFEYALNDADDSNVRIAALEALAKYYPSDQQVEEILRTHAVEEREQDDDVRMTALSLLVDTFPGESTDNFLFDRAEQDSHERVRRFVLVNLPESPTYASRRFDLLCLIAANQEVDKDVRCLALNKLAHLDPANPRTGDVFRVCILDEGYDNRPIRQAALRGLIESILTAQESIQLLEKIANHDRLAEIREWAAQQLQERFRDNPNVVSALLGILVHARDRTVREMAADILAKDAEEKPNIAPGLGSVWLEIQSGDSRIKQNLTPIVRTFLLNQAQNVKEMNPKLRLSAFADLTRHFAKNPEVARVIREHAARLQENHEVRCICISYLASICNEELQNLAILCCCAVDQDAEVCSLALTQLLNSIELDPRVLDKLRSMARYSESPVRMAAIQIMAEHFLDTTTFSILQERAAATDENLDIRRNAVAYLVRNFSDRRETALLIRHLALHDQDPEFRRNLLGHLVDHFATEPATIKTLYHCASSEWVSVRYDALRALIEHHPTDELTFQALLDRAQSDPSPRRLDSNHASGDYPREVALKELANRWGREPYVFKLLRHKAEFDQTDWLRKRTAEWTGKLLKNYYSVLRCS